MKEDPSRPAVTVAGLKPPQTAVKSDGGVVSRRRASVMRGERDHRKMVAIPTIKDEDAKRPNRERESLVREQDQIINRMKATLILLGIRGFNPKLKKAAERLEDLRTAEGEPKARDGTPTISTASSPDHRVNPDSYAVGARSRPSTLY